MPLNRVKLGQYKAFAYGPLEALRNLAWRITGRWRAILSASRACASDEDHWQFTQTNFQPCQKKTEILDFLAWTRTKAPRVVVEIGVARGGTSYLLTHGIPSMEQYIGVDFFPRNVSLLRAMARPSLIMDYARGPSCDESVLTRVRRSLSNRPIDLLFIDGDHAYAAVKRDWQTYLPLVRPGGWIVLHDIRQPELTSDGDYANNFEVAVHRFWAEIKPLASTREFVAPDDKPGYGIGVWQVAEAPKHNVQT